MNDLASKHCVRRKGPALTPSVAKALLKQLAGWTMRANAKEIRRVFAFKDYHQSMAFVNAVAWIAHREDHHPDMAVGYDEVTVIFATHSVSGLSENDFICAAKVDALGAR